MKNKILRAISRLLNRFNQIHQVIDERPLLTWLIEVILSELIGWIVDLVIIWIMTN